MTEHYLCKDCKHSFQTFNDWISLAPKRYSMRCKKVYKEAVGDENYVTGPKINPAHYERCGIVRLPHSACGVEGKLWEPKNTKKHMFLWLKKET